MTLIRFGEIRAAWDGSLLLLRNRPEGMALFDQSIPGFWRSFSVVMLLIPAYLAGGLAERKFMFAANEYHPDMFPDGAFWFAQMFGLAADWLTLPLLLAALAIPLGVSHRYVPFVVARNWTSLLASTPYLIIYTLYILGIFGAELTLFLSLLLLPVLIWYSYLVTRIALQAGLGITIGIVVLDVVLSLFIDEAVGHLWG
ncbi:hypothetical protein [Roseibium sp. M-1]